MTDANLMDADCIHGQPWWGCPECDAAANADMALLRRKVAIADAVLGCTIGKVGHVVMPDGTLYWKPADKFLAALLAIEAVE